MNKIKLTVWFIVLMLVLIGCSSHLSEEYVNHLNLSQTYIDSEDYEGALIEINEAIKLSYEAPEAYVQKGYVHLVKGELNQANEALTFVENHMDDFMEEDSKYAGLLNIGNLKYQQNQFDEALSFFEKAKAIDGSDPVLYNAIGLCYIALDNNEKAKEAYSTTIDLDGQNFYAYGNLASLFLKEGEIRRGLNEINTALGINPYVPQFYLIKGELLSTDGQIEKAIDVYTEALNTWDTFGDAYYRRGDLNLSRGNYLEAANDFSNSKDFGIVDGLLGLGYAYNGLTQYESAITAFSEYLANIEAIDLRAVYEIAVGYYQLENFGEAIKAIDELLKLEPEDSEALLIKAYSYEKLNQYEDAKDILDIIILIEPNHEKALEELKFIEENNLR